MQRRMAGRFFVVPFEVFDELSELEASARDVYYSLLRFHFIDEDWDTDTEWIRGRIRTTKADIWRLAEVGKGNFFERAWPSLIKAGLVVDNEDGTITIPKLKKKIDEGINPAKIREMDREIERLKAVTSDLVQAGRSQRKPDGSRTEGSSERKEREAAEAQQNEDEEQAERRRVLEYKEGMGPEERKQLRREAEEEIRKSGQYKDEFTDDFVIEIKENQILRRRLTANDIEG